MRHLLIIAGLLLLSACGPNFYTAHDGTWPHLPSPYQANNPPNTARLGSQNHMLLATAYQWLEPTHNQTATTLLNAIEPQSDTEEALIDLIRAKAALQQHRYRQARAHLERISPDALPKPWDFYYYDNRALVFAALKKGNASLRAHWAALNTLPKAGQSDYSIRMMQSLYPLSTSLHANAFMPEQQWMIQGYLQFTSLARTAFFTGTLPDYDLWQQRFAGHPLDALLQQKQAALWPKKIMRIGVLLPQAGPYAKAAEAIQTGLLAAYYGSQHDDDMSVDWVNTSDQPLEALLPTLVDRFDVVIGPLTKDAVQISCAYKGPLPPMLALNAPSHGLCHHDNVHLWHLSPQSELTSIAQHMTNQGIEQVVVITTQTHVNQMLAKGFASLWGQAHNRPTIVSLDDDPKRRAQMIKEALHVDQSEARYQQIQSLIQKEALRFMATRRHDVQAIFLALDEKEALKVVPLLHYYFSGNLPLFAPSWIYPGSHKKPSHDLHQVHWPSAPFLAQGTVTNPTLKAITEQLQQNASSFWAHKRHLLALGVDAWFVAQNLHTLLENPSYPYPGLTGQLTVDTHSDVVRQLKWYRFDQGHIRSHHHDALNPL